MHLPVPIALFAGLLIATPSMAGDIGHRSTLADVDAAIHKVAPIGQDVGPALAYLDANRLEHSDVTRERTVYAIVRGIRGGSFLIEKSASIRITYDEHRRVTAVKVYADYTGP